MKIIFSKQEEMLFALLRSSLKGKHISTQVFSGISADSWQQCYQLAVRQGVMALAWDGIMLLPEKLQPPRMLKIAWGIAVEQYEKEYYHYCRTVHELSAFYSTHGISTVQLKGVGFSSCYPVPAHREGGDIDIFTFSTDTIRMSHTQANRLADELMERQGIEVDKKHSRKHSVFYYKGVPIENHKSFLNVDTYRSAAKIEGILIERLSPQTVQLSGGKYNIDIPSPVFNTLFIASHAIQHYVNGLTLHHLCDWACLLNRYGLQLPPEITDKRFLRAVNALTQITNELLGTDIQIYYSGELAEKMIQEILHPPYGKGLPVKGKADILVYKTRRLLHMLYLRKEVLDESVFRGIARSVVAHISKPHTIFGG